MVRYKAAYDYSVLVSALDSSCGPDAEVTREVMAQMMYSLMHGHATGPDLSCFSEQELQAAVIYVCLKQVMETGEGIAPSQTGTSSRASAETSGGTLANGKPATEENVLALMEE